LEAEFLEQLQAYQNPSEELAAPAIYDSFFFRGHFVLAMELFPAGDLYSLLSKQPGMIFDIELVRRYTKDVAQCLLSLQEHGVIHGDVKPENVLLCPKNKILGAKLADFGLAKSVCEAQAGDKMQTRYYRAPEIVLGVSYDTAIDMWSLGCMVAEMLMGRPLFDCNGEHDLILKHMELLGLPPQKILGSGRNTWKYFDDELMPRPLSQSWCKTNGLPPKPPGSLSLRHLLGPAGNGDVVSFVTACLTWDPRDRLSPYQALQHVFVTGTPDHSFMADNHSQHPFELGRVSQCSFVKDNLEQHSFMPSNQSLSKQAATHHVPSNPLQTFPPTSLTETFLQPSPIDSVMASPPWPNVFPCMINAESRESDDILTPLLTPSLSSHPLKISQSVQSIPSEIDHDHKLSLTASFAPTSRVQAAEGAGVQAKRNQRRSVTLFKRSISGTQTFV